MASRIGPFVAAMLTAVLVPTVTPTVSAAQVTAPPCRLAWSSDPTARYGTMSDAGNAVIVYTQPAPDAAEVASVLDVATNVVTPLPVLPDAFLYGDPVFSRNGRYVAYSVSTATTLSLVVWDRQGSGLRSFLHEGVYLSGVSDDGRSVLVTENPASIIIDLATNTRTVINQVPGNPVMSGDGRYVAITTGWTGLDDGLTAQLGLLDRTTGVTVPLPGHYLDGMSADGRWLLLTPGYTAYSSSAVVTGSSLVYDRTTGASVPLPNQPDGRPRRGFGISATGRYVLVKDHLLNELEAPVGVLDRSTGTIGTVGRPPNGPLDMSSDGTIVMVEGGVAGPSTPVVVQTSHLTLHRSEETTVTVTGANLPAGLTIEGDGLVAGPSTGSGAAVAVPITVSETAGGEVRWRAVAPNGCVIPLRPVFVRWGPPEITASLFVITDRPYELTLRVDNVFGDFKVTLQRYHQDLSIPGSPVEVIARTATSATVRLHMTSAMTDRDWSLRVINPDGQSADAPIRLIKPGLYYPVEPTRIHDSRNVGKLGPGETRRVTLQLQGLDLDPRTRVDALVVNLTGTEPSSATYLTAFPAGSTRPLASTLNLAAGATRANLVTVPTAADGSIDVYNALGSTHVVLDLVGVYITGPRTTFIGGSVFAPTQPFRWFDSRLSAAGPQGAGLNAARFFPIVEPYAELSTVVINLTATAPTRASYLSVISGQAPQTSNLNFAAGQTVPNLVHAQVENQGTFQLYNHAGSVHTVIDVIGAYRPQRPGVYEPTFNAVTPTRMLDTRTAVGGHQRPALGNEAVRLALAGNGPIPAGAKMVIANVTVTEPATGGWIRAYPTGQANPTGSNLNFVAGETVANTVVVPVGPDGSITLLGSATQAHYVVDVVGYFA